MAQIGRMPAAVTPAGWRRASSIFEAQPAEFELSLVNPAKQFDAGNCERRCSEPLEAEHWADA